MPTLKTFYGSNPVVIQAEPMTLGAYNELRGWELEHGQHVKAKGYLMVYLNSNPNTTEYDGYVTWADKEPFESSFRNSGHLTCGHALEILMCSEEIALSRNAWKNKETLIFADGAITIMDVDGRHEPWIPTPGDMVARDYFIVESSL